MKLHMVHNIDAAGIWEKNGLAPDGRVQRWFVMECMQRMDAYLPYRTGASSKMAFVVPDGVVYIGPHFRMLYYGKVMVDPVYHCGGFMTPDGWRSRKGVPKVESSRDIQYDKTKNKLAGPLWDKRMWADHKDDILRSLPIGEKL